MSECDMKFIFMLPNMGAGGAERVVSILSRALVENGVTADIVMLLSTDVRYELHEKVGLIPMNTGSLSTMERIKRLRQYFVEQKRQYGQVVAVPFQHNCLKYALMAAVGLGVRVVACERNDPNQKGRSLKARLAANIPYLLADRCVFQTPDARDYYVKAVRKKGKVIENPLVLSDDLKWRGHDSNRIVSVGRLDPQKNQKMLIDAFSAFHQKHPDYVLDIYGEGALKPELQAQIEGLGLQESVFLRGYASDIHERLTDARMFVLSSDYEGMSNALMEALAIGVPVVTTDHPIGGARMLIENGVNGLMTPVGDSAALSHAMDRLISQPEFAEALGSNGVEIRKRLDVNRIMEQWLLLFDKRGT